MQNIGEEIVGVWLKICRRCEFVEYNLQTPDTQGEIDVVGINVKEKRLYVCEAATHLVTGLMYVDPKTKQPDNINRLIKKFLKDIDYARKYFKDYQPDFMLWSPIVKSASKKAKHNQTNDIQEIVKQIKQQRDIELIVVKNEEYQKHLEELRAYAKKETKDLKSPVLRLMQIEEKLKQFNNSQRASMA